MPRLVSERIKKLREEIAEISEANRTHKHRRDVGQPPTKNGGSNDCRKFWMSLMCGSQDLTLQAILSNGVATVRQTLSSPWWKQLDFVCERQCRLKQHLAWEAAVQFL